MFKCLYLKQICVSFADKVKVVITSLDNYKHCILRKLISLFHSFHLLEMLIL